MEPATITNRDIELIRQSRVRDKYGDFSDEERAAYQRAHAALNQLGWTTVEALGGPGEYVLKLTSGFHPASGVRGRKPKDLWFGVYRRRNETALLGNPQVFMIVSARGIEYGFSPLTHPDDFSNQEIKRETRKVAPQVLRQLPEPGSSKAIELASRLETLGPWCFRRKQRLDATQSEYASLDDWLAFVRSDEGVRNAGGGITRYVLPEEVDGVNLPDIAHETAQVFRPLMEAITPDALQEAEPEPGGLFAPQSPATPTDLPTFADLLHTFLHTFSEARLGAFRKSDPLWTTMAQVTTRLEQFPAVHSRPDLIANISVGQGNWASVAWIALLNTKVTRSTQEGVYVVFLIAKDLTRIFLTLNQGTTKLVNDLGQSEAQAQMLAVADATRRHIGDLAAAGFALDNVISLGASGWLAKNYEIGTIAHIDFEARDPPDDVRMNELLEAVLTAYDTAIDAPVRPAPPSPETPEEPDLTSPEPYGMEDALTELFLDQATLERLLAIWDSKKNLILHGAPGVGKTFVGKRLAYLLLGSKDAGRVETIQFHQSYSYEDFVQGYRPDGAGGFTIRNGVFHRFCEKARLSPERPHVFVIDEINRGNLSKILGELMLLIEHDKRGPGWAATLTYAQPGEPRFYVPENLYILGMMNTADRSLSIVDYALRRRFSFAPLQPMFGNAGFREFLIDRGVPEETLTLIVSRMSSLNQAIAEDRANLGPGYRIGHSFFVPGNGFVFDAGWYRRVIETEIHPLLEEYWFDDPDKADTWRAKLLDAVP